MAKSLLTNSRDEHDDETSEHWDTVSDSATSPHHTVPRYENQFTTEVENSDLKRYKNLSLEISIV